MDFPLSAFEQTSCPYVLLLSCLLAHRFSKFKYWNPLPTGAFWYIYLLANLLWNKNWMNKAQYYYLKFNWISSMRKFTGLGLCSPILTFTLWPLRRMARFGSQSSYIRLLCPLMRGAGASLWSQRDRFLSAGNAYITSSSSPNPNTLVLRALVSRA